MTPRTVKIRPAKKTDLDAINHVIESAVMSWRLPGRVKRLSLPSYRYDALDFNHLEMVVAEIANQHIAGVAAWEQADTRDTPNDHTALLLHGIYVDPEYQRQGIGRHLYKTAERAARKHQYDGILVKAQSGASGFFISQRMNRLQIEDLRRDYVNRFWKTIKEP